MHLLAIETSGDFCSVAAGARGAMAFRHQPADQRHGEVILGLVDEVMAQAGLTLQDIGAIAYGEGPGAFTGLRVACGVAQGLALARGIGVIGVGTLAALAQEAISGEDGDASDAAVDARRTSIAGVVACIDARMGEVYHAAFRRERDMWSVLHGAELLRPESVPPPEGGGWIGCGSGFAAYGGRLCARLGAALSAVHPEATPTARAILELAWPRFLAGEAADPASAVPVYLRDKVALKTSERT